MNEVNSTSPENKPQLKIQLFKIGIFGFIGGLMLFFSMMVLMAMLAFSEAVMENTQIFEGIINHIELFLGFFFAIPFIFFGVMFASLLMKPREFDVREEMKSSMTALASFFVIGLVFNVVLLMGTMIVLMVILYMRAGMIIFLAIAYFLVSGLLFFVGGGYALIREVASMKDFKTNISWVNSLFKTLRLGDYEAQSNNALVISQKSERALTRLEKVLGWALGIALFFLFKLEEMKDTLARVTGHGFSNGLMDLYTPLDLVLGVFSAVIFIFSSLFIIKTIKMVLKVVPSKNAGGAPPQPHIE